MTNKRLPLAIIFLFYSTCLCAQVSERYPVQFSQFFRSYALINPAALNEGEMYRFQVNSGQQMHGGPFSLITTFYTNVNMNLSKDPRALRKNGLGFSFVNDKEGDLLSYKRVNMYYSFNLPLTESWQISAGIHAGFLNFSAEQTVSSSSISSYAPDMGLGFLLHRERVKVGLSGEQILNARFRADQELFEASRHYNIFIQPQLNVSKDVVFTPVFLLRVKKDYQLNADLHMNFLVRDIFMAGAGYRYSKGVSYHIGLNQFEFLKGLMSLMFTYNSSALSNSSANLQTFEISLNYHFLPRKDIVD